MNGLVEATKPVVFSMPTSCGLCLGAGLKTNCLGRGGIPVDNNQHVLSRSPGNF